jgi:hypothetical protein
MKRKDVQELLSALAAIVTIVGFFRSPDLWMTLMKAATGLLLVGLCVLIAVLVWRLRPNHQAQLSPSPAVQSPAALQAPTNLWGLAWIVIGLVLLTSGEGLWGIPLVIFGVTKMKKPGNHLQGSGLKKFAIVSILIFILFLMISQLPLIIQLIQLHNASYPY